MEWTTKLRLYSSISRPVLAKNSVARRYLRLRRSRSSRFSCEMLPLFFSILPIPVLWGLLGLFFTIWDCFCNIRNLYLLLFTSCFLLHWEQQKRYVHSDIVLPVAPSEATNRDWIIGSGATSHVTQKMSCSPKFILLRQTIES